MNPRTRIENIEPRVTSGNIIPKFGVGNVIPNIRVSLGEAVISTVWTYNQATIVYNQSDYTYDGLTSVFNYPPLARAVNTNITPSIRIK